jgi:prepilin-type N-terminal cleavage/methylation domain-containing protein
MTPSPLALAGAVRDRRSPAARGFSLIEILVVVAIIALVAAVVIPQVSYLDGVQMKSAARTIAGAVRITYATAVTSRNYYRIVFDLNEHSYRVEKKSGDQYVAAEEPLLQGQVLPDSIYFKRVEVAGETCLADSSCTSVIYFTPGGYVEEAAIYIATVDDAMAISVFTRPMTGHCAILMGDVPMDQYLEMEEEK